MKKGIRHFLLYIYIYIPSSQTLVIKHKAVHNKCMKMNVYTESVANVEGGCSRPSLDVGREIPPGGATDGVVSRRNTGKRSGDYHS